MSFKNQIVAKVYISALQLLQNSYSYTRRHLNRDVSVVPVPQASTLSIVY